MYAMDRELGLDETLELHSFMKNAPEWEMRLKACIEPDFRPLCDEDSHMLSTLSFLKQWCTRLKQSIELCNGDTVIVYILYSFELRTHVDVPGEPYYKLYTRQRFIDDRYGRLWTSYLSQQLKVAHTAGACIPDPTDAIITRKKGITTLGGVMTNIYFRRCDGKYSNALREELSWGDNPAVNVKQAHLDNPAHQAYQQLKVMRQARGITKYLTSNKHKAVFTHWNRHASGVVDSWTGIQKGISSVLGMAYHNEQARRARAERDARPNTAHLLSDQDIWLNVKLWEAAAASHVY